MAAFVHRSGVDSSAADEIVGAVLIVAWRRLADMPPDPDKAVSWLIGVARRVTSNHRRSQARRAALATRIERDVSRPRYADEDGVPRAEILEAWRRLSGTDQLVLVLAGWQGLAVTEIATVIGCSTEAAAKRLVRARKRLRDAIDDAS